MWGNRNGFGAAAAGCRRCRGFFFRTFEARQIAIAVLGSDSPDLAWEKPTDNTVLKPTGRYLVSAATFKGLLLAVHDTRQRVPGR